VKNKSGRMDILGHIEALMAGKNRAIG